MNRDLACKLLSPANLMSPCYTDHPSHNAFRQTMSDTQFAQCTRTFRQYILSSILSSASEHDMFSDQLWPHLKCIRMGNVARIPDRTFTLHLRMAQLMNDFKSLMLIYSFVDGSY